MDLRDIISGLGRRGYEAWHGSPYDFSKFAPKYGTGEGFADMSQGHYIGEARAVGERYKRVAQEKFGVPGHLYHLNVHEDPENYLNFDKGLREQTPQVEQALRNILGNQQFESLGNASFAKRPFRLPGAHLGFNDAEIANNLQQAGIPGIKYLDARSRAAGEGTRNFVHFNPETMEIIGKYGVAGAAALGGAEMFDPSEARAAGGLRPMVGAQEASKLMTGAPQPSERVPSPDFTVPPPGLRPEEEKLPLGMDWQRPPGVLSREQAKSITAGQLEPFAEAGRLALGQSPDVPSDVFNTMLAMGVPGGPAAKGAYKLSKEVRPLLNATPFQQTSHFFQHAHTNDVNPEAYQAWAKKNLEHESVGGMGYPLLNTNEAGYAILKPGVQPHDVAKDFPQEPFEGGNKEPATSYALKNVTQDPFAPFVSRKQTQAIDPATLKFFQEHPRFANDYGLGGIRQEKYLLAQQHLQPMDWNNMRNWIGMQEVNPLDFPQAAEQGYNVNFPLFRGYSGASSRYPETQWTDPSTWDPEGTRGIFTSGVPSIARTYHPERLHSFFGRPENPMEIDWSKVQPDRSFAGMGMTPTIEAARNKGADLLRIKGMEDIGSSDPQDQFVILRNPQLWRRTDAAFDPKKLGQSGLMLGGAGAAMLPWPQQNDQQ